MTLPTNSFSRRTLLRGAVAAATVAGTGVLLAACAPTKSPSGSSTAAGDTKVLNVMIPSWVDPKFISEIMQGVAAATIGARLNVITVDDGTFPAQAAAAQKSGQAPDLLMWTAQGVPSFLGAGVKLLAINDQASHENKADFYAQDYTSNSVDGKLYGLGYRADCRGIAYRTDFAKNPAPKSWTFDEFGEWAEGLAGTGRNAFGYEAKPGDGRASSNVLPLFWSTGKPFVVKDGSSWKVGFSAEDITPVMKFYYDTVHTWNITPSEVANWGYQDTDGDFAKGTLASYSAGPFVTTNTQKYPETRSHLAIASLPYAKKPANFWEELSFMIHQDSKKQDLAWKFMEAMRSVEVQAKIVARTNDAWLGVRPAANATIKDPILGAFVPLLKQAVVPEPINVNPIFNQSILPTLGSIALNKTAPEAAAASLIKTMTTALATL